MHRRTTALEPRLYANVCVILSCKLSTSVSVDLSNCSPATYNFHAIFFASKVGNWDEWTNRQTDMHGQADGRDAYTAAHGGPRKETMAAAVSQPVHG